MLRLGAGRGFGTVLCATFLPPLTSSSRLHHYSVGAATHCWLELAFD
ncbi:MAG: hypothetical protein ACKESB_03140 [Candidatus Hodgkinia cicadicola]